VRSRPQAMLWPTGACLGGQEGARAIDGTVPCTASHTYEVVGSVNAAARFASPPPGSSALWNSRLGNDCDKVARARFGGRLPTPSRAIGAASAHRRAPGSSNQAARPRRLAQRADVARDVQEFVDQP
jgi:hypothetical protein